VNPVPFDSVLQQSRVAHNFGSRDILGMFEHLPNVVSHWYGHDLEDFGAKDLRTLDTWVFDRLRETLENATARESLGHGGKAVVFLHLLGLDSNGHAHKPYSKE
jgi:phosphatidylinositol glycan class N